MALQFKNLPLLSLSALYSTLSPLVKTVISLNLSPLPHIKTNILHLKLQFRQGSVVKVKVKLRWWVGGWVGL